MSKKMIMLKSSDGETFEIDEAIALQSQTIAHMVEDDCANNEIPLANVKGTTISKVIEYCKKHDGDDSASEEAKKDLKKWDAEFMEMDLSMIYELNLAANYLNVKGLLDLSCQTVADLMMACKTHVEIREKFGIENDFTPEEEEKNCKENEWAFE
ncbi:hypothetical protein AALP_AA5G254800 [Arabis alpina]|uniref:SKP1-like protein n=1 Tax=Arabis alpina TaxID=50452 RepID=A0A087GZA9_ARAAL|nr:hypothetical protein AALP_AA5G254800 [Arabis alpina]